MFPCRARILIVAYSTFTNFCHSENSQEYLVLRIVKNKSHLEKGKNNKTSKYFALKSVWPFNKGLGWAFFFLNWSASFLKLKNSPWSQPKVQEFLRAWVPLPFLPAIPVRSNMKTAACIKMLLSQKDYVHYEFFLILSRIFGNVRYAAVIIPRKSQWEECFLK